VKRSNPDCEPFIGVFVEPNASKSNNEANWAIKGIKFGRAERELCNAALTVIVERMKREFEITSD
jgi:hypothetical protein